MANQYDDPKCINPTPQTWRTKWRATGKLIATFSSESMARFMYESANRSFPGEVILEQIPADEPEMPWNFGYGRDEDGE